MFEIKESEGPFFLEASRGGSFVVIPSFWWLPTFFG
jgi:hypothetical protein